MNSFIWREIQQPAGLIGEGHFDGFFHSSEEGVEKGAAASGVEVAGGFCVGEVFLEANNVAVDEIQD